MTPFESSLRNSGYYRTGSAGWRSENQKAYVDLQLIAREVIKKIGYTKGEYMFESNSCGVLSAIHEQSPDINRGVERQDPAEQGAGDQSMMFRLCH